MEEDCLRLLLDALLGSSRPAGAEDRGWWQRRAVARRAEEYMEAHLHLPRTVREICAAIDVSERTLEYAFREQFGLGPLAYYKARRLNAVREQLKRAKPEATAIHAVACRWGFRHTGGFAADYRRQFGELPSQTVRDAKRSFAGSVGRAAGAAAPPARAPSGP
jgi:AraC family ethanolamine operon transcriptional activator